ncbi:MAG: hypothetical protein IJF83_03785 [Methanobrevibacter sp.]|nr:hypothetical protein [Methanobrevibacter sp.]
MEEIVELGTDLNCNWEFKDGDLQLVENKDNLIQSILNRLNCNYDGLDLFYYEYGSVISSFLGWKHDDETLEFIRLEVESTLEQEPRLDNFNVEVSYNKVGKVLIELYFLFNDESDFTLSLVLEKGGEIVASGE